MVLLPTINKKHSYPQQPPPDRHHLDVLAVDLQRIKLLISQDETAVEPEFVHRFGQPSNLYDKNRIPARGIPTLCR